MKEIFVFSNSKYLRIRKKNLIVVNKDKEIEVNINIDRIKCVNIFGNAQVSTQTLKILAAKKKSVHYYTYEGRYIGSFYEPHSENYSVQSKQLIALQDEQFNLEIAKKIISNKIRLQKRLLEAHDEDHIVLDREYANFESHIQKIQECTVINEILGYEGRAAKSYFYNISLLIHNDFRFRGRSKRPPLDPFNSMISFGYDILYGYLRGAIRKSGLNMGFGCIHKNRNRHAALASDLMEEWRPVLIDDTVLQLIKRKEIKREDFKKRKNKAIYINNSAKKIYLNTLHNRMLEGHYYFSDDNKRYTFISGVDMQVNSLRRAIDHHEGSYYYCIGEPEKNYV